MVLPHAVKSTIYNLVGLFLVVRERNRQSQNCAHGKLRLSLRNFALRTLQECNWGLPVAVVYVEATYGNGLRGFDPI
jgi:hypothetical protein